MKKFFLIPILLICLLFPVIAEDITLVDFNYGSDYYTYYCSVPVEVSNLIIKLEDATYYVEAYYPGTKTVWIIQFTNKKYATEFCQKYAKITGHLSSNEKIYYLDQVSNMIIDHLYKYCTNYYPDYDYFYKGRLYRYSSKVYGEK